MKNHIKQIVEKNNITIFSDSCYGSFLRNFLELQHTGPSGSWYWNGFLNECVENQDAFFNSFLTSNYKSTTEKGMTRFSFENGITIYFNHYINKTVDEISEIYDRRIKRVKGNKKIIITAMESKFGYTTSDVLNFVDSCQNAVIITDLECEIDRVISIPEWRTYLPEGSSNFYEVGLRFYDYISDEKIDKFYNELIDIVRFLQNE